MKGDYSDILGSAQLMFKRMESTTFECPTKKSIYSKIIELKMARCVRAHFVVIYSKLYFFNCYFWKVSSLSLSAVVIFFSFLHAI